MGLAFQRVQEPLLQGLSALTNLVGKLVKDTTYSPELDHVMESVALLGDTNWKLNMRCRELIKPDLNPPIHGCARKILHLPQNCFGMTSPNISRICLRQKRRDNNRGSAHPQWRRFARFKPCDWGTAVRHQTPLRKKPQPQATKLDTCSSTSM